MGNPRQGYIAFNKKQRDDYIKRYIKYTDLYISVYKFPELNEEGKLIRDSAIIDKAFFDLDSDNWLPDLWKIHDWCDKGDILRYNQMSGRGGHNIIAIDSNIDYPKQALGNFQRWLAKELDIDIDRKIIGDVARIFRYPNTYNFKARRFCIPIPREALDKKYNKDWYFKMATKQQRFNGWTGSKLLSLKRFDEPAVLFSEFEEIDMQLSDIDENIETQYSEFPLCVKSWLSTPLLTDYGKFILALFLRDQLYLPYSFDSKEVISIMKKSLSNGEFQHYFGTSKGDLNRRHYGHRGVKFYSLWNGSYYMPNCYELQSKGMCTTDCGRRHPIHN
jgi:hypothetical protein